MTAELGIEIIDDISAAAAVWSGGHVMYHAITAYARIGVVNVRTSAARVWTVVAGFDNAGTARAVQAGIRLLITARIHLSVDDGSTATERVLVVLQRDHSVAARMRPVVVGFGPATR